MGTDRMDRMGVVSARLAGVAGFALGAIVLLGVGAASAETPAEQKEVEAWCGSNRWDHFGVRLTDPAKGMFHGAVCKNERLPKDVVSYMDRQGFATPVTRALYLDWCLRADDKPLGANYAICMGDAEGLTKDAVSKDLDGWKLPAAVKARMLTRFDKTKQRIDDSRAVWTDLVAKGPVCEAVLKTAPEKALAEVREMLASHEKVLTLATNVREALLKNPDEQLRAGQVKFDCSELRTAFREFVTEASPADMDAVPKALVGNPVGYQLLTTLALCDAVTGTRVLAAWESSLAAQRVNAPAGMTGERAYVRHAFMSAYAEYNVKYACGYETFPNRQLDAQIYDAVDPILHIANRAWSFVSRGPGIILPSDDGLSSKVTTSGQATVQSLKPVPSGVEITFKKEWLYQQNMNCKNTGVVVGYDYLGRPDYARDCKWSTLDKWQASFPTMTFDATTMVGVKPGTTVKFTVDEELAQPYKRFGLIVATVQPPKGGSGPSKLLTFYGAPINSKAAPAAASATGAATASNAPAKGKTPKKKR